MLTYAEHVGALRDAVLAGRWEEASLIAESLGTRPPPDPALALEAMALVHRAERAVSQAEQGLLEHYRQTHVVDEPIATGRVVDLEA